MFVFFFFPIFFLLLVYAYLVYILRVILGEVLWMQKLPFLFCFPVPWARCTSGCGAGQAVSAQKAICPVVLVQGWLPAHLCSCLCCAASVGSAPAGLSTLLTSFPSHFTAFPLWHLADRSPRCQHLQLFPS